MELYSRFLDRKVRTGCSLGSHSPFPAPLPQRKFHDYGLLFVSGCNAHPRGLGAGAGGCVSLSPIPPWSEIGGFLGRGGPGLAQARSPPGAAASRPHQVSAAAPGRHRARLGLPALPAAAPAGRRGHLRRGALRPLLVQLVAHPGLALLQPSQPLPLAGPGDRLGPERGWTWAPRAVVGRTPEQPGWDAGRPREARLAVCGLEGNKRGPSESASQSLVSWLSIETMNSVKGAIFQPFFLNAIIIILR